MLSLYIILAGISIIGTSGFPACFLTRESRFGQRLTTGLVVLGGLAGLSGLVLSFGNTGPVSMRLAWLLPFGSFALRLDSLSAVFLALVFIVPGLGSLYGLGYWKQAEHTGNGRKLGLFYGLLAGSMGLVCIAQDGVLFLLAWEAMALAAWFAATVEEENPEAQASGWVYLIATHIGTLCLFAMFALWAKATGSFGLEAAAGIPAGVAGAIFVLAALGFGFKAGLMPLHVWLPGAHANAPSHVSALMSGVMLKMGIYGIVRMTSILPAGESWWGSLMLAAGAVTSVAGIAFALGQKDLKRILAYSSIENIGVITMGIGLALLGRTFGRMDWMVLGMGGALFHVWNHGLFKSLLFLNSGSIIHATHTRNIELLGGLSRKLPVTAGLFLVGAVAISALPPLNGFAGELLLYLGLFRTLAQDGTGGLTGAAMAAVALAMTGAMATACFVKLYSTLFLGAPRSDHGSQARESAASMLLPMLVLAAACVVIGLYPALVLPAIDRAVNIWTSETGAAMGIGSLISFGWISIMGAAFLLLAGLLYLFLRLRSSGRTDIGQGTWDCGYARPTARMQYTGSSFSQILVDLFSFLLWPKRNRATVESPFPEKAGYGISSPDTVLDRLVKPVFALAGRRFLGIRSFQQGQTHMYVLYVFIITLVLLVIGGMGV